MTDDHKPICVRLGALATAVLGDTLREMGFHHQALHHSIAGLDRGMRRSSPAFCMAGEASMGGTRNSASGAPNPGLEMFRRPLDGRVLVIATGRYDEAPVWGENIALSAKIARVGGVVVDGGLRDVLAQIEFGIPTWARFVTPVSSAKRWRITRIDDPIAMHGQTHGEIAVEPGDPIVAGACARSAPWSRRIVRTGTQVAGQSLVEQPYIECACFEQCVSATMRRLRCSGDCASAEASDSPRCPARRSRHVERGWNR